MAPSLLPPKPDLEQEQDGAVQFVTEGSGANVWVRIPQVF